MTDAALKEKTEEHGSVSVIWNLTNASPKGEWWKSCGKSDKTVHVFGNLDGGTLRIAGTSDYACVTAPGTEATANLKDIAGDLIGVLNLTNNSNIVVIAANPIFLRPVIDNPGVNTNVKIVITGNYVQ